MQKKVALLDKAVENRWKPVTSQTPVQEQISAAIHQRDVILSAIKEVMDIEGKGELGKAVQELAASSCLS